jgi:hypothetical protein
LTLANKRDPADKRRYRSSLIRMDENLGVCLLSQTLAPTPYLAT